MFAVASALLAIAVSALAAAPADAATVFRTGFDEPLYTSADAAQQNAVFQGSANAGASIARINIGWADTVGGKPKHPTDPSDPAYNFAATDAAVRAAKAHGLDVMLTVYRAPPWAEGKNPNAGATPGTWMVDAKAFGEFAQAVARRYSGNFNPGSGVLPKVSYFEAWNEPNLSPYLSPQYKGNRPLGAIHYRSMVNAFYAGIHKGQSSAKVIAGATAPYGSDPPDAYRTRPLRFLREFLCLRGPVHHLQAKSCPNKPKFDILSDHPITLGHGPRHSAISPWDAATADMDEVARMLNTAERLRTVGTNRQHPLWATEIWWESDPPDNVYGTPTITQAHWLEQAFHDLWSAGARTVIWFQLVDEQVNDRGGGYQTGVLFEDGKPKPSFTAFRFPFVTQRRHGTPQVVAWTIPPVSGAVQIQRKSGGHWRTIARGAGRRHKVFQRTLTIPGSATLRAVVGGEQSLSWSQGGSGGGPKAGGRSARAHSLPSPSGPVPAELAPYVETP